MAQNLRIIVITYSIPRADITSGEKRLVGILELLAKYHNVHLCVSRFGKWLLNEEFQAYVKKLEKIGIKVLPLKKNVLKKVLVEYTYDIGFFEFYWIAEETLPKFRKLQPNAFTIIDSVDVAFVREETQVKLGLIRESKARKTKKRELGIYKKADATIAVSDADYDILVQQKGIENVFVIPNIVPVFPRSEEQRNSRVIFLGSYLWPPNIDAVKWFVKEIWPIVYQRQNKSEFLIIGSGPTDEIKEMSKTPGVNLLGFVPETKPYLDSASVSVAPIRYGGGMKGKINEAMAQAIPVVATSIGAHGFNAVNNVHMMIEDSPERFANAIIDLLGNPEKQKKIGLAGQKLNHETCSPEVIENRINDMIDSVLKFKNKKNIHFA